MSDRFVSHYKILEKIGGGGMGVVYKALDTKLGRTVALKFLPSDTTRDETAKKRFLQEAQAASLLDHPNICGIHEIDETEDGQVFICMAFCDGESLKARIERGPLPIREVCEIICSLADGLVTAHERGIIHRDIKPGNVVITFDGFVKIVDFGLAKLTDKSRITRSDMTLGTVAYMSPEQVLGNEVDGRTDIWSLGVLAYEALTAKLPFSGEVDATVVYKIVNEDPTPLRKLRGGLPRDFEAIIEKCLAKDPSMRYQNVQELLDALFAVARRENWHSSRALHGVIRVRPAPLSKSSYLPFAVVLGVVMIAALLFSWLYFDPWREDEAPLYSTTVRLAVLPAENLSRKSISSALADGVSIWLTTVAEQLSGFHSSMWVVPYHRIRVTNLGTPRDAIGAFGVNSLVRPSIQRFGGGHRLVLELLDAATLRRLRQTHTDIDDSMEGVQEAIVHTCADLLDIGPKLGGRVPATIGFSSVSSAASDFLEGIGYLEEYKEDNNLDRALESLTKAVDADSVYADALAALALAELRSGLDTGDTATEKWAWDSCLRASQLDSSSVYVRTVMGAIATQRGNMEDAVAAYTEVIALDPRNTLAFRRLGDALNRLDRVDEAETAYRSMIELKPDYWEGYINLGYFLSRRGRADEAVDLYNTALSLAPNDWWTLNTLGAVYVRRDEWSRARQYFLRSFAIRPRCYPCVNIGTLYYFDGLFAEAAKYFKFALEYCDSNSDDYYQRWQDWGAALYWVEGRRGESMDKFERAVELAEIQMKQTPDNAELLAYTAGCYAMLENRMRALELIDRVTSLTNDTPMVSYHVGWTYEKLGDRERALAYLTDAIRMHYSVSQIRAEPLFRELVDDIRFKQLLDTGVENGELRNSSKN